MSAIPRQFTIFGSGGGATAVTAAAVITDNAIVRGDGGARGVQTSTAILNDGTLTGSSGTAVFLNLPFTVNQSGIAGYTGLVVRATESATGSGTKLLAQLGTAASSSLFTVDNTGVTTISAILRSTLLNVGSLTTAATTDTPAIVRGDTNGIQQVWNKNDNAGSAALASFLVESDAATGAFVAHSAAFTPSGLQLADGVRLTSGVTASAGLTVGSRANAPCYFGTNDTFRGRFTADGDFVADYGITSNFAPSLSDGTYRGTAISGTAGAALAFGDAIYLAVADSRWELIDADAEATCGPVLAGICVLAAAGDGSATRILINGVVRADAAFPTFTVGAPIYFDVTAGDLTNTAPSGTGDIVRVAAQAIDGNTIFFNPDGIWTEVA